MYIVCDIGGTYTRVGFSQDLVSLIMHKKIPSHPKGDEGVQHVFHIIRSSRLDMGDSVKGIVVGFPGRLTKNGSIHYAPHLPGWEGLPLEEMFKKEYACPLFLENDSALCGLGEAQRGAGRGCDRVAFVSVGTGVGGALVVRGHIQHGEYNVEPGHMIMSNEGPLVTLDGRISGSALERRGGYHNKQVAQKLLAHGLRNVTVMWDPDCIVLGGGLIRADVYDVDEVRAEFESCMNVTGRKPMYPELPLIRKAQLGDEMGLYGGLEYMRLAMKRVRHEE